MVGFREAAAKVAVAGLKVESADLTGQLSGFLQDLLLLQPAFKVSKASWRQLKRQRAALQYFSQN